MAAQHRAPYDASVLTMGFAALARLRWRFLSGVLVLAMVLAIAAEATETNIRVAAFITG
jgi:hypothetical protein